MRQMKKIRTSEQRPTQEAIERFIYRKIRCSNIRLIRTLFNIISKIPFIIKCYSQILWLPKIIKGYQYKLSAQTEWHEHYKKIAKHKTQQVDDIMEKTVDGLVADLVPNSFHHAEDMKEIYQRWGLEVPTEYLTEDEFEDKLFGDYDDYLASGGVGDLDHIYWNEKEGNKLLGGFDVKR